MIHSRLIFNAKELKSGNDLKTYGVTNGSNVWLVRRTKAEIEDMLKNQLQNWELENDKYQSIQFQYEKLFSSKFDLLDCSMYSSLIEFLFLDQESVTKEAAASTTPIVTLSENRISVQGLPKSFTIDDIIQMFGIFGTIMVNKRTGRPCIWMCKDGLGMDCLYWNG